MNVSRLLFDPALLPKHGAVEGNGDEFGSPRGGEENRGLWRQLNNKNEISVAMWRRSCRAWEAWCSGKKKTNKEK